MTIAFVEDKENAKKKKKDPTNISYMVDVKFEMTKSKLDFRSY